MKEFDKAGIPAVQLCNLVPVALTVGANRILPTLSIPYPLGDPSESLDQQYQTRKKHVLRAIEALGVDIKEQRVFNV